MNRPPYGSVPLLFVWSASELDKRHVIQLLSAVIYNAHVPGFLNGRIFQGESKAACVPGLNCYSCPGAIGACPLGAFQSVLSGTALRIPFYVLGTVLLFGILAGRFICGWLCPFGLIQEALYRLPGPKLRHVPGTGILRYFRYGIAVVFVLILPVAAYLISGIGEPAFCKYICPAGTLEASVPLLLMNQSLAAAAGWITVWKFFVLAFFLVLMICIYRPFCRFVCPLGVWYGLWNRRAMLGIAVAEKRCTHCGTCHAVCPAEAVIAGNAECISCGRCVESCPEKAIYFRNPLCDPEQLEVKSK